MKIVKADTNLNRLKKTVIPINFIKKNKGAWNHQQWLEFCQKLQDKGYTPINFDEVGLLLERKKLDYLSKSF